MSKELKTSAKHYNEKSPPRIWNEFSSVISDFSYYREFSWFNSRNGKNVPGVALYGRDDIEGIERILIMRLWPKSHGLRGKQILLERWPEEHFFGPDTVASLVNVSDYIESPWNSLTEDPEVLENLSLTLSEITDRTWRKIASEILSFSEAERTLTKWFGIDLHP